ARLSIKEAADVLHFLGNVEPLEGEAVFDGGREHVGLTWILTWVDRSLTGRHPRGAA
ncbi:MAG: hypothetical protein JNL55_16800, partial [Steroidobacter sp.]|nr:hypothetical protein [Steroidobacter sp.]